MLPEGLGLPDFIYFFFLENPAFQKKDGWLGEIF